MSRPSAITHSAGGTSRFPLFALGLLWLGLFPQHLLAHGSEFLSARLRLTENQSVIELQITADYSHNPLLADEAAAREALHEVLNVQHQGQTKRLTDLAPLEIQAISDWQESLPASLIPPPDGQTHQLLSARWRWMPDVDEVRFSIPPGCVHDVLLWQQDAGSELKSTLLITGDVSPAIPIQRARALPVWSWLGGLLLLALLVVKKARRK